MKTKTVTIKNLNEDLVLEAKKIVSNAGWKWEAYLRQELEKRFTEIIDAANVEKIIMR